jgi:hypothetical protein
MKATKLASRSVAWKALGWCCALLICLHAPAHGVRNPLGVVLTVPISPDLSLDSLRSLNGGLVVNLIHSSNSANATTFSFAEPNKYPTGSLMIHLPAARVDAIRQMNNPEWRDWGQGLVEVPASAMGDYDPDTTGTHFFLVPDANWQQFKAANGSNTGAWKRTVYFPQPTYLQQFEAPAYKTVRLSAPGWDLTALNTGNATSKFIYNTGPQPIPTPDQGAKQPTGPSFTLTEALPFQYGAAWFPSKQYLAGGFTTSFQFRMAGIGAVKNIEPGGDGFAFVIQNYGIVTPTLPGGFLGYHGLPRSLAVEFDTYFNTEAGFFDPDGNHISVHTRYDQPNSVSELYSLPPGPVSLLQPMNDGAVHQVQIHYDPGLLSIYVDNPSYPVLVVPVDLSRIGLDVGRAYLGFTASTWASYESHEILNWDFRSF